MPFTVNVSVVEPVISATTTIQSFTITETNQSFNITTLQPTFTITNFVSNVEFNSDGGMGFDFVIKNLGEWQSGQTYSRNDVVRYAYSIYIANTASTSTFVSTIEPPNDTDKWELFYYNEWPKSFLTITNDLTVGKSITANTGTFNSQLQTNKLIIGSQTYPTTSGLNGQVLITNGTSTAYWDYISELIFWNLTSDLQTNGFNIVTGYNPAVPNPPLKIISGDSSNVASEISFEADGVSIDFNTPQANFNSDVDIDGLLDVQDSLRVGGTTTLQGNVLIGNNPNTAKLSGPNTTYPVPIGSGGILFNDGTIQTTAGGGGGGTGTYVLPIASGSILGGIRVGDNLTINPFTGVLTANIPSPYILPTATTSTLGGIKIGSGLFINGNGVVSVNTNATGTNFFNLTQDSFTNGFKISYDPTSKDTQYITLNQNGSITLAGTVYMTNNVYISGQTEITQSGAGSLDTSFYDSEYDINGMSIAHPDYIFLRSPRVRVGTDINNSRLHTSRIYNYAGTGPPWFPEGIQLPDNTVQVTAYNNDCGLIP